MVASRFAIVEMQAMAQAHRVAVSVRTGIAPLRFAHDKLIVAPEARPWE
jgi:hypothetical protein